MKKVLKSLLCALIVGIFLPPNCSAFFIGSDKYTKKEYAKAGITWEHNIILPDKYYFNGKSISQSDAEKIVKKHIEYIKECINLEIKINLEFYDLRDIFYAINFIKNREKDKETQIKKLKSIYEELCNKKILYCTNFKNCLKSQIMDYIQKLNNKNSKVS